MLLYEWTREKHNTHLTCALIETSVCAADWQTPGCWLPFPPRDGGLSSVCLGRVKSLLFTDGQVLAFHASRARVEGEDTAEHHVDLQEQNNAAFLP